jgi:hypothetical protein
MCKEISNILIPKTPLTGQKPFEGSNPSLSASLQINHLVHSSQHWRPSTASFSRSVAKLAILNCCIHLTRCATKFKLC